MENKINKTEEIGVRTLTPEKKKADREDTEDFPSSSVLVQKSITITEETKWEMETIAEVLRDRGVNMSVSEMIRLCIHTSWENSVKPALCGAVGFPVPSFYSK